MGHGISWLQSDKELFVIEYDTLKANIQSTLRKACDFLNLETTDEILACVEINQEGAFHRLKSDGPEMLVFSEQDTQKLEKYKGHVEWFMERRCPNRPNCLPLSSVNFTSPPYQFP